LVPARPGGAVAGWVFDCGWAGCGGVGAVWLLDLKMRIA